MSKILYLMIDLFASSTAVNLRSVTQSHQPTSKTDSLKFYVGCV